MKQAFRHVALGLAGALIMALGVTAANAQPYPYWDGNSGYYYNTPSFDYSGPNRGGMVETPGN
jgi:hypothetical protein